MIAKLPRTSTKMGSYLDVGKLNLELPIFVDVRSQVLLEMDARFSSPMTPDALVHILSTSFNGAPVGAPHAGQHSLSTEMP